jgi:hypothetical protein
LSPEQAAALALLGFAAGVVSSLAGGASVLTTPALIFLGHSAMTASATNFVALSPASFAAVWVDRAQLTRLDAARLRVCAVSFLGALAGGVALLATGEVLFRQLTPALLGLATFLYWIAPRAQRLFAAGEREAFPPALLAGFAGAGAYSGYFGTGYGVILLALLRAAGVTTYLRANMLKNLIGCFASSASVLFFASTALVHWPSALTMGAGNIAGGFAGARLAHVVSGEAMRRVVLSAGVVLTVALARRFWFS